MFKKLIAITLVILMVTNTSYAYNLVTITAENGKSADLDLDSIKMGVDTVEYTIYFVQDDKMYSSQFSSELYKEGNPTAIIHRTQWNTDGLTVSESVKRREYKPLKPGTLHAEIFEVLSKNLKEKQFSQGEEDWNKYLKKQKKYILKVWKPMKIEDCVCDYEGYNAVYNNFEYLDVHKDGRINSKELDDGTKLDKLPENYPEETFTITVVYKNYKYMGARKHNKKPIEKNRPDIATIYVAKNSRPIIIGPIQYGLLNCYHKMTKYGKSTILDTSAPFLIKLVWFPVELVGCIVVPVVGFIFFGALFAITGGDTADLSIK